MLQGDVPERDLTAFVLPELGRLHETGNQWAPYQLLAQDDVVVDPVRVFFAELQAEEKPASTIRSYGMNLLRWWRFLWALDIEWNRATRMDARDFIRWMQIANKPQRLHWRHRKAGHLRRRRRSRGRPEGRSPVLRTPSRAKSHPARSTP